MKLFVKLFLLINLLFLCIILFSCATSNKVSETSIDTVSNNYLSLYEAIEKSANETMEKLAIGDRIAIVAFSSEHENLSNFIMDELTGAFVGGKLEVADRRNLAYVYRELNFNMSGEISDDSAVSIGKFLGAQYILSGQFLKAGDNYRYRISVINVETAIQESSSRLNVRFDRSLQNFISDVKQTPVVIVSANYSESRKEITNTAGTYLDRGILFASRGDYNMAITEFTEAINLDNNLASAYLLRGRALYASASYVISVGENFSNVNAINIAGWNTPNERQSLYDNAISDFTQAIRLDPNSANAYRERGIAYSDKGDHRRGILDLNQTILLSPNNPRAYINRGNMYRLIGDYDRAITDYNQAIRLDPNSASAYMNRGGAYRQKGNINQAIADCTQAIRLDPNNAVIYNNRATHYITIGNFERAISDYTQSIRLDPNNPYTYDNRGTAYYNRKDFNRAIADYEIALRLAPNDSSIKKHLENAQRMRGY
jgi:tetratricopeptide (TPR) repeat protein